MTEQQPYTVVRRCDAYELRRYPGSVIAEVTVDGTFEEAGNRAFRPLVEYIGGRNTAQQSMAMTAPVVQEQRLAMTAPVVQAADGEGRYSVAFVLPASVDLASAPTPTDPRVHVRAMPSSLTAVSRYSGRWSQSAYERHLEALRLALEADGLVVVGEPRFARFDPPFKPWFMRRNEVHLDVAAQVEAGVRKPTGADPFA